MKVALDAQKISKFHDKKNSLLKQRPKKIDFDNSVENIRMKKILETLEEQGKLIKKLNDKLKVK